MQSKIQRVVLSSGVTLLVATVFVLGRQNRSLKRENRDLVTRFTNPHRGFVVPSFSAVSLTGDTVVVGEMARNGRQVLFFFTTSCQYCRASFPALRSLAATAARDTLLRPQVLAVALDSSLDAVRRFADSVRVPVPILQLRSPRLATLYRITGVPQLMVLDSAGRTTYARAGEISGSAALDSVMAGISWRPGSGAAGQNVPGRSTQQRRAM